VAQNKFGNEWITGGGGQRIHFDPVGIKTSNTVFYNTYFSIGHSCVSDSSGNLILCSSGFNIYDSNANVIDEGDTLVNTDYFNHYSGWSLYPQSSIFLPMDSGICYFVTPTYSQGNLCYSCHFDLLQYSIIDLKANAGASKVIQRTIPILQNVSLSRSQMMACRHSNGKDWWLLKQGGDSNTIYKFLFTQDSVYSYGSQSFINPIWGAWDLQGQSMFTQDGSKYATGVHGNLNGEFFIADFDRCYGILSNPKTVFAPIISAHYPLDTTLLDASLAGLAFSPNGKLLYLVFGYNIFQYDIEQDTFFHVAEIDTSWQKFQKYSSSYLGPDNKLYIGNWGGQSEQMSVINNPDIKGVGCNFCPRCLRMDSLINGYAGTPPCMPNYALGAQECWPLEVNNLANEKDNKLEIFPNPAFGKVQIKSTLIVKEKTILKIFNSVGQVVYNLNFTYSNSSNFEIDISKFSSGIYFLKVGNSVKKLVVE